MSMLRRYRYDARLSRRELAREAGVSHETIRQIERGRVPSAAVAGKLADALSRYGIEIAPSDLLPADLTDREAP